MEELTKVPVQITLRPYASSIPLASLAFGVGNVVYSAFALHWIPPSETRTVAWILLGFVAPLELGPSVMAFLTRDAGGATTFAIFGAAWVIQGLLLLNDPLTQTSQATGIFLLCLALCLVLLTVVTMRGKPLMGAVLIVAILRTSAAAVSEFTGAHWAGLSAGWSGLLLAFLAFYCGLAFLEEDVTQRISPLTLRTGEAKAAMEGKLEEQVAAIGREAGVRKQL